MKSITKDDIKVPVFGIFLMTIFTFIWGFIAENALNNRDHRVLGILFTLIILVFIFFYIRFLKILINLPEQSITDNDVEKRRIRKYMLIISSIEGISIFVINTILINLNLQRFFIPSFALIVGLHFFPLGVVLKNKFHYYMGYWTTTVAVAGFILTYNEVISLNLIIALVCVGCSISTITFGIRFILMINSRIRLTEAN